MSVTAVTSETLEKLHATSFSDFVTHVPGMNYTAGDPGHTTLILRGINAGGIGSTIGTYLDETPYGSSSALANGTLTTPNIDTFDIERVEILRGPQGTLYGSSTLGGLLKFVSKAPDTSGFAAEGEVGGSTVNEGGWGWETKAMVNVPLGDMFAVRATGYMVRDPGFIDDPVLGERDVNDVRNDGGRVSLLFKPMDNLSFRVTALMQDLKTNAGFDQDMMVGSGGNLVPTFGPLEHGRGADEFSSVRYRLYNATADYDMDWASLLSTTSYGTFNDHILTDATNVYGLYIDAGLAQKKFTEELRLTSPSGEKLEWLAGVYYTNESGGLTQNLVPTPGGPVLAFLALNSRYVETALFGNFTYHFSPAFDVTIGGRFAHDSQNAFEFGLASQSGQSDENVFTYSFAPRWHINDDITAYARIAKGWRPGGPNALPPNVTPDVPKTYDADSLVNYELGVKSTFLDNRLSVDADIFHIDWEAIQLLEVVQGFGINANGGRAQSDGFEWAVNWLPLDGLDLNFGGAYTHARLTTLASTVGGVTGDNLPYTPMWSTSLDADYTFPSMGGFTPFVGASWQFTGSRASAFLSGGQSNVPSYNTFDLRAGLDYDRWSITLYGKNLGDERGISQVGQTPSLAAAQGAGQPPGTLQPTVSFIRPRTIGLTLTGKL
jgi:outer membrane receptor protein involved in Fe transport